MRFGEGRVMGRGRLALAMALLMLLLLVGVARADWDDRPDPSEFEASLETSGYWVDESHFGRVWRPFVAWDWRPYVDGHWLWTSYGWTWMSAEPWGWTFHYGRWGWSDLYGWVWAPGYVWGPAWVDWYWGDGFVGWAPLGPPGFTILPGHWTYVHDDHFCAPSVTTVVVGDRQLPDFVLRHRENGWGRREAPALRDIELVSRHPIPKDADRPKESVAPWVWQRLDRGELVRERVADRDGERVVEHPGLRTPDRRQPPAVVDDGGWRRGGDRDRHVIVPRVPEPGPQPPGGAGGVHPGPAPTPRVVERPWNRPPTSESGSPRDADRPHVVDRPPGSRGATGSDGGGRAGQIVAGEPSDHGVVRQGDTQTWHAGDR